MVVPQEVLEKARSMLQHSVRPLIFHDDDPDGTCSFAMIYQFCHEGKGVAIKSSPVLSEEYTRKVDEYSPDLIVILDKPKVAPEFFEKVKTPTLWIDHHEPQTALTQKHKHVLYLNPRIFDDKDNRPTSYWSYQLTQTNLWIATIGCIADWHIPDFIDQFKEKYPDLMPEKYEKIEDLYLDTKIATLIRVIQFNLKGQSIETKKSVLTLTRIESPYEILDQTSSRGRFLWKKYEKIATTYNSMMEGANAAAQPSANILEYIYKNDMALSAELSNELLIRYPTKVILVGRNHDGFYKCSARSKGIEIPTKLTEALKGCEGYGGGHKFACGLVVAEKDWEKFFTKFSELINEDIKAK